MGNVTNQQDPTVGKVLDDIPFEVTDPMLADYYGGLGLDYDPEEAIASMVAGAAADFHAQSRFAQDRGHLWMRQEWDLRAPLQTGIPYVAHALIENIYRRRDRTVVVTMMSLDDDKGRTVMESRHHQSFLLDEQVEQVEFRNPAAKEGARTFTRPEGSAIDSLDVAISLEMCGQYFHGQRSYHTDRAASEALGFADVVVGGRMTMSYVGHILERHFGDQWWRSGHLDLKFTNPVWPDDHLTVAGIETGPAHDGSDRRSVFAWIEKQDGTIAVVANATCAT